MNLMVSMGVSLVAPSMTRSELCPALADLSVPLLLGPDKLTTDYVVSNTKQSSGKDITFFSFFFVFCCCFFVVVFCFFLFLFFVGWGGGGGVQAPLKTETFELEDNGKLLCV